MKVLFVVPYPLGQAASQRFRFEQYLPQLEQKGVLIQVIPFWSSSSWRVLYQRGKIIQKIGGLLQGFLKRGLLITRLHQYDIVFIHREATPVGPPWFEWLVAKVWKKRIIFDFDDAIWLPDASVGNTIAARLKWHHKTAAICSWSYRVSCGNSYLQQYALAFNKASVLMPTTIDTRQQHKRQKQQSSQTVTVGWTGSHSTLPYLRLVEPVLQQLQQQYQFEFVVIADKAPELNLISCTYVPWRKETEVEDLLRLNIGIMPLPDTEWAKGKCAFKALQYMALGIPAVVSAVGANKSAVVDGITGFCCSTPEEWYKRLEQLILDPELRAKMGAAGRAQVEEHYSVTANTTTFLSLFS
ncbi:glycosyltransferase family 4 protein [Pontibacter beigongshangensis]|uniref:glycosyltransferase family 4 protein n=1 Tax=Pontibacter beigongshangensis TaxID=2574733 RepID=UPI00164F66A0|nr:glycosyltransferase [Pontibacter beigongshangensis]